MNAQDIIARIIELAGDEATYETLLETNVSIQEEALFDAALSVFDGWDGALVAALREVIASQAATEQESSGRSAARRPESVVERRITEAFEHPLYVMTSNGRLCQMHGSHLAVSDAPEAIDAPESTGHIKAIDYVRDPDSVFLFSSQGRYFGVDIRMIPNWPNEDRRTIRDILFLEDGEEIMHVLPRQAMNGRVIHITRQGKGKATDADEFGRHLDKSGREAFLVNDGDAPCAVISGPTRTTVFCASALGQGIHFDSSDLRSMGRKAVGVNVMKLGDAPDEVVGAFIGERVKQFAVITRQGFGKRVDFEEFRLQGRGGGGMQLMRLNPNDYVAAIAVCNPQEDLAVITSTGRVHRMPTTQFQWLGRAAKGTRVTELEPGEVVVGLTALPCGSE